MCRMNFVHTHLYQLYLCNYLGLLEIYLDEEKLLKSASSWNNLALFHCSNYNRLHFGQFRNMNYFIVLFYDTLKCQSLEDMGEISGLWLCHKILGTFFVTQKQFEGCEAVLKWAMIPIAQKPTVNPENCIKFDQLWHIFVLKRFRPSEKETCSCEGKHSVQKMLTESHPARQPSPEKLNWVLELSVIPSNIFFRWVYWVEWSHRLDFS